ncbi:hypothetical protein Zm00014a_036814, partial [Zea mays]
NPFYTNWYRRGFKPLQSPPNRIRP